jgi:O-antigen/teichoic acid export membrane protein
VSLKKNYLYYSIASALPAALGFIIAIFLSRNITTEDYGYIGVFAMILFAIEPLLFFFNHGLLELKFVKLDDDSYSSYKLKYINFGLVNFLILLVVFIILAILFKDYTFLLLIIPFIALTRMFLKIVWMEFIQSKKAKEYAFSFLTFSLLIFCFTLVSVGYFDMAWEGRLISLLLPEILVVIYFFYDLKWRFVKYTKQEFSSVLKFGTPLFIALGGGWLLNESDKFIVLNLIDLSSVGIYTFAYLIGRIMIIVNQPIMQILRPIYYSDLRDGILSKKKHIRNIILFTVVVFSIAILINSLLGYFIEFIPESYRLGLDVVKIIVYAFACFGVYQVSFTVLDYYKMNTLKTKLFYLGAFINIVFSVTFINNLGILAPAYGTLLGFFVVAIFSIFYSLKYLKL